MARTKQGPTQHEQLLGMVLGYGVSQLLFVAAELGLADQLARGPQTPAMLAKRVGADAAALYRVLRALASVGVFAEGKGGRFRLTPLARRLCSDHPASLRDFARMVMSDYSWNAWGALLGGVRDGSSPFERVHGTAFFDYLQQHPEQERVFSASMASLSGSENAAIARAYPFGRLTRLVDVGGAHGHLLATILRKQKKLCGVLYDQPQVVAAAAVRGFLGSPDVRDRCDVVGGSFFESVPPGGDGYLMKYILHDWDDEHCIRILRLCRDAMAHEGRVLVADYVIRGGNTRDRGKLRDINMFVLLRGRERTREEFRALFAKAGLALRRVFQTDVPLCILEAVRA